MGATDTVSVDAGADPALVETIQDIKEGDVLVLNGDSRTWDDQGVRVVRRFDRQAVVGP